MKILDPTYPEENAMSGIGSGPMWDQHEWRKRYDDGEATLLELQEHEKEIGVVSFDNDISIGARKLQKNVRSRVDKIKGIDMSQIPSHLRGLTIYRLRLKENMACERVVVRKNQDWGQEGKVVVELVDKDGRVIDDIIEE